jgi:hypothetical protein
LLFHYDFGHEYKYLIQWISNSPLGYFQIQLMKIINRSLNNVSDGIHLIEVLITLAVFQNLELVTMKLCLFITNHMTRVLMTPSQWFAACTNIKLPSCQEGFVMAAA